MNSLPLRGFAACMALACYLVAPAQINIQDRIERSLQRRAEEKLDRAVEKTIDKVEEGVDKTAKDGSRKKGQPGKEAEPSGGDGTSGSSGSGGSASPSGENRPAGTLKSYSKYDFIPGEQVVAVEDFMQDAIGDFPAKWNTNGAGEVVTIAGREGRWLKLGTGGIFYPEFLGSIPENATVEFDVAVIDTYSFYCGGLHARFRKSSAKPFQYDQFAEVRVGIHPQGAGGNEGSSRLDVFGEDGNSVMGNERSQSQWVHNGKAPFAHVAIWRQKNRLRFYLNEEK
ncbi:MAG: hypothetical protein ACK4L7_00660, partial [Flavobacteriales bacterium]